MMKKEGFKDKIVDTFSIDEKDTVRSRTQDQGYEVERVDRERKTEGAKQGKLIDRVGETSVCGSCQQSWKMTGNKPREVKIGKDDVNEERLPEGIKKSDLSAFQCAQCERDEKPIVVAIAEDEKASNGFLEVPL